MDPKLRGTGPRATMKGRLNVGWGPVPRHVRAARDRPSRYDEEAFKEE